MHRQSVDPTDSPRGTTIAIEPPADTPPDASPGRGLTPFDDDLRDHLGTRHWQDARHDRRAVIGGAVGVLALHVLFALVVWQQMRPHATPQFVRVDLDQSLLVDVTMPPKRAAAPPPPMPPSPPAASRQPPPKPHPPQPHAKDALVMTPPPASSVAPGPAAAPPKLFGQNGMPLLPASAAAASPSEPGYAQRMPQGDMQIMRNQQPLPPRPTAFSQDWGKGGGAVTNALDKAVQKTTVTHTFHPLPGVRIHCAVSLAMLAGGCGGDSPPPPSVKDGDERLNMAPPPLALNPHPFVPPSVASCIAVYNDGKPLPQGCPTDTSDRAIQQQLDECIARYRAGQHLPARCPADTPARAAKVGGSSH